MKKSNRLPKRHLKSHKVPLCEEIDEDEGQHDQKGSFIYLVFERLICQDEGVSLMTEHDGIH